MTETAQSLRDHWWWRLGWRVGRSFYTWHVTFNDQRSTCRAPARRRLLPHTQQSAHLNPIPLRWLHLTMQGIGFTDEVNRADVDAIADAARYRRAALAPFTIALGPAQVDFEALLLPVRPAQPITWLRAVLRAAIADVWGPDSVPERIRTASGLMCRWRTPTPPAPPSRSPTQRLAEQSVTAAEITVHRAMLIDFNRDHRVYKWNDTPQPS